MVCEVCSRIFRRESDCKRHKCVAERRKPVSEQRGSVQCQMCRRWFRIKGGFHVCRSCRRLSAAGNVSRDTCCPFGGVRGRLTAALQQEQVCVCVFVGGARGNFI